MSNTNTAASALGATHTTVLQDPLNAWKNSSARETFRQLDYHLSGKKKSHRFYTMQDLFWGKTQVGKQSDWVVKPLNWLADTDWHLFTLNCYWDIVKRIETVRKMGTKGVVILGNPGAGKSRFLDFTYVHKLCAKEPIIYFVDGGVGIHMYGECYATKLKYLPDDVFEEDVFEGVIALIEWNGTGDPPSELVGIGSTIFPVQAASDPRPYRLAWTKRRDTVKIVMNPPSVKEILMVIRSQPRLNYSTEEEVTAAVTKWGRNIRTIRKVLLEGDEAQEQTFRDALEALDDDTLSRSLTSSSLCYTHNLITSWASKTFTDTRPDSMRHSITSRYISRAFLQTIVFRKMHQLQQFYLLLHRAITLGSTKGVVFENLAHQIIVNNPRFDAFELIVSGKHFIKTNTPQVITILETLSLGVALYSNNTDTTETKAPSVYYIPHESDNPTFDSYTIVPEGSSSDISYGIGFQMTVGRDHSLKSKGLKLLMARIGPSRAGRRHKFVFVIPDGSKLPNIPAPTRYWRDLFDFYVLGIKWDNKHFAVDFGGYSAIDRPCDGDPELPPGTSQDIVDMDADEQN